MKWYNLLVVTICVIWDICTTVIGTSAIFGDENFYLGLLFAFMIIFFSLNTKKIFSFKNRGRTLIATFYFIVIGYDFLTSFFGNLFLVENHLTIGNEILSWTTLIVFTLTTSLVPIFFSIMKE